MRRFWGRVEGIEASKVDDPIKEVGFLEEKKLEIRNTWKIRKKKYQKIKVYWQELEDKGAEILAKRLSSKALVQKELT